MNKCLNNIRRVNKQIPLSKKVFIPFIFKIYSWIFSKKLCDDLVWDYSNFPFAGFCLLVCEREKQTGIYVINIVLRRDTLRSSVLMGTISIVLAFLLDMVIPVHFG